MTKVIIALVFFALGGFAHYAYVNDLLPTDILGASQTEVTLPSEEANEEKMTVCIQVITPARNPNTGEIREFPTPCDVPEGWEKIENDIPSLELDLM